MTWQPSSRTKYLFESGMIVLFCALYLVFRKTLAFKEPFIVGVLAVAALYIFFEIRSGRRSLASFGIRFKNLGDASRVAFLLFFPFLVAIYLYGVYKDVKFPPHFYYTLALYPIWGLIQQLVFQGIFLENLLRLGLGRLSIPLTALLYCAVHWPTVFMLYATLLGGLVFATFYYCYRNIIPLGIVHGLLGGLIFFVILGRDPFARFIQ